MEARRLATCYDDENALELVFPKEFANAEFISNSEALIHLERHREELIGKGKSIEDDELFKRFYSHCKALAKFDQNGLTEARSELKDDRMERYEMAALLDLLPQDLEECYELIPSLGRYKEEQGDFSRDASNQTEDRLIALLESIRSHHQDRSMSREASDGGASSKPKKSLNPFKRLFGKSSAPSLTRGYITPYGAGSSDAAGDLQLIRDYHNLYKHKLELHLEGRNQFIILFDLHDLLLDVVYVSTHGLRIVRKSKDLVEITGPEINETIKLPSIRTSKLITAPPKHFEELMNATTGAATPESPLKHNGNIPVGDEVCEDDQNEDDENTAEEPTTEELKVEEPKVEKAKVEEPKVEKAKVEEAEVEQPEVEEAKVEVPNVEVTKVEVTKVEEPKVEEAKVEQPKVEEPKVEETKVEETKVEEAKVEQPKIEEPKVDETKVEEPKVEELRVEELKVEETKVEETKVEQPKVEEAKVEEAKVEEPKVEEIKDEETKIEEPKVDEIKVEEIKVEETKIEEPKVDETKVEKAKVEKAKVEETRVEEAKVEQPIIEEPIIEEPKIEEPKIEEPKIEEPKIEETKVEETKVEVQTEEDLLAKVKDVQHLDVLTRGRPRANTRRLPTRRGFDIKIDSFDDLAIPEKDDFVVKQPATPTRGPGFGMPMGGFQLPPVGGVKLRSSVGDGESADPAPRPNPNRMTIAAGAPIGMVPMFNPAEAKLRKVGAVPKEESTESAGETKQIDFRDVLKKKKAAES